MTAALTVAQKSGEAVKAGPIGLAVILLLCIACYFLFKSMSRHMRNVRENFPVDASETPTSPAKPVRPTRPTATVLPTSAAAATTPTTTPSANDTAAPTDVTDATQDTPAGTDRPDPQ